MDATNLLYRRVDGYINSKFNEGLTKRKNMCWDPGLDVVLHKTQYCEVCPTIVRILHTNQVSTWTSSVCQDMNANSNLQYLNLFCLPRYERKFKPPISGPLLSAKIWTKNQTSNIWTSSVCQDMNAKSNLQYLDLFCLPRYERKIKPSISGPLLSAKIWTQIQTFNIWTSSVCQDMNANSNLQDPWQLWSWQWQAMTKPMTKVKTSCLKVYWVVCNVHGCSLILYKRNLGPFFNCPTTSAIGLTIQVPKILKSPPCLARCITFLSLSSITYQIGNQPPKKQLPKKPWTFNVLVLRRSPTQRPFVAVTVSSCAAAPRLPAVPGAAVLPPPGALRTDPGSLMALRLGSWRVWRWRLCKLCVYIHVLYTYLYLCL